MNAPDLHRVRLALPYLRELGWEPTVLAVRPELIEGATIDPELARSYPADIPVVRAGGVSARWTRRLGVGNLWWRCGPALRRAGRRLLARERFDLVFFSTTQFAAFQLGPEWRRRHGVPYVLDYQDPWITDHYARTGRRPPGGAWRFALSQWSARRLEPRALRGAAGIITVSPEYAPTLAQRYPWFDPHRAVTLPFGVAPGDFALARQGPAPRALAVLDPALVHHVYVGRCGAAMAQPLTALFRAFRDHLAREPEVARRHRFHFVGTDYAPPALARDSVLPIAQAEEVGPFVAEHRERVPYYDALRWLLRADALIAVGTDEPAYNASKLFPYLFADRPLLLVYHRESPALRLAQGLGAGVRLGFDRTTSPDVLAEAVRTHWFQEDRWRGAPRAAPGALEPWTAPALTRRLTEGFERALAESTTTG